ncbi:erythromycin esterase [Legionella birminghamensis]|uniref:Erythromycin esterase n=1 Tax=Legionella birminghamensis TaxID=28083 RepID=A0A378I8J1_9GAMM|nr:erythromycin esterase family protein [Legionella birminghamensis]KTC67938.1 erythromycin esterase [Legionella birminghamensis]STX31353.1 erythromycin esterase [Legionella birminghamensis]
MDRDAHQKLITCLNDAIEPFSETGDYSSLLEKIDDARFVMIGEATHGTHEFYQTRIEITKQLIKQKGFMAVAIEGDWTDAYRVHRYLQGWDKSDSATALNDFRRFPSWMWRNTTMPPFLKWLCEHNDTRRPPYKLGFYGLDLYSLNASMEAVVNYLMKVDPQSANEAKNRYACFDHMTIDPQMYAYFANSKLKKSCIREVIAQLRDIQHNAFKYIHKDGITAEDDYFFAAQNARVVKNAEIYYRSMFEGHVASWNIRDRHMAETINVLADHLEHRFDKPAKIIIWAHNSHVGDARATEMGGQGEVNIGQLVREQYTDTYSIGFSTYEGFVTAASNWDMPAECKKIVPGFEESYEELFHQLRYKKFSLHLIGNEEVAHYLKIPRLQRAIGVIYRPETERLSHYFFTQLPYQFDSLIHFDKTTALQPLPVK